MLSLCKFCDEEIMTSVQPTINHNQWPLINNLDSSEQTSLKLQSKYKILHLFISSAKFQLYRFLAKKWVKDALRAACHPYTRCCCFIIKRRSVTLVTDLRLMMKQLNLIVNLDLGYWVISVVPGRCGSNTKSIIFKIITQNSSYEIYLTPCECKRDSLMGNQHWFRQWLGTVRHNKPLPKPMLTKTYSFTMAQWVRESLSQIHRLTGNLNRLRYISLHWLAVYCFIYGIHCSPCTNESADHFVDRHYVALSVKWPNQSE